jgi:hypothetical protein
MCERVLVAIGERSAARLRRGDAPEDARVVPFDRTIGSLQPLFLRGRPVDVVLDDRLVRYFVVTAPAGTASLAELRRVAGVRFEELFALDPTAFELAGDWRVAGSFLCCAMPRAIGGVLAQAAASARASLVSIAPLFVRVVNAVRQLTGWIVVRANGWVTAAHFESGAIRLVRSTALDAMHPLESWLARLALVAGSAVATAQVLDADQPRLLPDDWQRLDQGRRDVALLATLDATEAL